MGGEEWGYGCREKGKVNILLQLSWINHVRSVLLHMIQRMMLLQDCQLQ